MKIALQVDAKLPVRAYGGTERVVWGLGRALSRAGHSVTLLGLPGSRCDFGDVVEVDSTRPLAAQIPEDVDLVHFQNGVPEGVAKPYIVTIHGNLRPGQPVDPWSVFVSRNHAERNGREAFVHNGIDWEDYPRFRSGLERKGAFFLGKASWKVKNVRGAIRIAREAGERLDVLGGNRLSLKMDFRFTPSLKVRFHGMVDNGRKGLVANSSRGLIFPVLWDEPFGLAMVESLYFGAPVFATPRGSLPELILPELGFLSEDEHELAAALRDFRADERLCHDYAAETFNADVMAANYLRFYERRLNGENFIV